MRSPKDNLVSIRRNIRLAKGIFLLECRSRYISSFAKPGQFIQIKIDDEYTLLRRPFGILGVSGDSFSVLYMVKGKGTRLLS